MKYFRQLLRQPLKFIAGVIVVSLAVSVLCVCLGQSNGIAAKLFAEVEHWAKEMGAARLDLYTWDFNKDALAMYHAMGMTAQRYVLEKKL